MTYLLDNNEVSKGLKRSRRDGERFKAWFARADLMLGRWKLTADTGDHGLTMRFSSKRR